MQYRVIKLPSGYLAYGGGEMSFADKVSHKAREVRGRIKRTTGSVTGNWSMEAEGRAQEVAGKLGQTDERIKDAFRGRSRRRHRF
jgi:uncharacterized protein YjbJ (UPF0337 family)